MKQSLITSYWPITKYDSNNNNRKYDHKHIITSYKPLRTSIEESIFWSSPMKMEFNNAEANTEDNVVDLNHLEVLTHNQSKKRYLNNNINVNVYDNEIDEEKYNDSDIEVLSNRKIDDIPCEIWLHIFNYLDYDTLNKVSYTGRYFKFLTNTPALWQKLCLKYGVPHKKADEISNYQYNSNYISISHYNNDKESSTSLVNLSDFYKLVITGKKMYWVPKIDKFRLPVDNAYKLVFNEFMNIRSAMFNEPHKYTNIYGHEHGVFSIVSINSDRGNPNSILTSSWDGIVKKWNILEKESYKQINLYNNNYENNDNDNNNIFINDILPSPPLSQQLITKNKESIEISNKKKQISIKSYALSYQESIIKSSGKLFAACIDKNNNRLILAGRISQPILIDLSEFNIIIPSKFSNQVVLNNPVSFIDVSNDILIMCKDSTNIGLYHAITHIFLGEITINNINILSIKHISKWDILLLCTNKGEILILDNKLIKQKIDEVLTLEQTINYNYEEFLIGRFNTLLNENEINNNLCTTFDLIEKDLDENIFISIGYNNGKLLLINFDFIEGDYMLEDDNDFIVDINDLFNNNNRLDSLDIVVKKVWEYNVNNSITTLTHSYIGKFIICGLNDNSLVLLSFELDNNINNKIPNHIRYLKDTDCPNSSIKSINIIESKNIILSGAQDGSISCWQF